MNESKELLEATIKGLEDKLDSVSDDLRSKQRELADVNKQNQKMLINLK